MHFVFANFSMTRLTLMSWRKRNVERKENVESVGYWVHDPYIQAHIVHIVSHKHNCQSSPNNNTLARRRALGLLCSRNRRFHSVGSELGACDPLLPLLT